MAETVRTVKPVKGHMKGGPMGPKPKVKNPGKTFRRLIEYTFSGYKLHFAECICSIAFRKSFRLIKLLIAIRYCKLGNLH